MMPLDSRLFVALVTFSLVSSKVTSFTIGNHQTRPVIVIAPERAQGSVRSCSTTKALNAVTVTELELDMFATTTLLGSVPTTTTVATAAATTTNWWQNSDVWVFVAGVFPFAWATVEFWRRIAVGEPFGTGKDSVYIGKDNVPAESRGRRTLDRGAFLVAYILFGLAAGAIGITLYSVVNAPATDFTSMSITPPQH